MAHEVLVSLSKELGVKRVIHTRPNGMRDRQGKDFLLVIGKGKKIALQIKAYRVLDPKHLEMRIRRMRGEGADKMSAAKRKKYVFSTVEDLRNYMQVTLRAFFRLSLLMNDRAIREEFKRASREEGLNVRLVARDAKYEDLIKAYEALEHFFNIFDKAINHATRYPGVKLFLIVDTSDGISEEKQRKELCTAWLPVLQKALVPKPS